MAAHDLIAEYRGALRGALGSRVRHADRICDEVEDHLRSAAEELRGAAGSATEADRRAIECFGPVEDVASRFMALEREGGAARATRFTTRAGLLGLIGGLVIAVAAALQNASGSHEDAAEGTVATAVGTVGLVAAVLMVGVGFVGIVARHRGSTRRIDSVALGLIAIGFAAMWLPFWGTLAIAVAAMLLGTILFGIRVYRVRALPRPPLACMLLGGACLIALTATKADKSSVEYATGWVLVLTGWCWLQFTLWSERPERRTLTT